jgi:glyoxylase-like metal-dependent hydrolase (beta-lactamase superfamily II)
LDTGIGNKESEKFRDIYGVDNAGDPTRLETAMRSLGFDPVDVDLVVNTHLHFDHAGGNVIFGPDQSLMPAFPRARTVVQRGELEFAASANERVRASYMDKNFRPLVEAGLVDLVDGATDLTDGIRLLPTPGHTPFHQSVILRDRGDTAIFLADLCPTAAHLPLPWIMGYDLEPLVTLETKRRVWQEAREEGWTLIFQHDASVPWGRLDGEAQEARLLPLDGDDHRS